MQEGGGRKGAEGKLFLTCSKGIHGGGADSSKIGPRGGVFAKRGHRGGVSGRQRATAGKNRKTEGEQVSQKFGDLAG